MKLTYNNIQKEAEDFSKQYRRKHKIPSLPTVKEVQKYRNLLYKKFSPVVDLIKERVSKVDPVGGHGFEHLGDVATRSGYIAEKECDHLKITGKDRELIIESAVLAGALHDIERHLGFGEDHMIEGEKTTRWILDKAGLKYDVVALVVRNHDHIDFDPGNNKTLTIVFAAVFDADHLRYGLEREDTFWRMKEKGGKSVAEVIHDYQYLPQWRNVWRTKYGKTVGPKIIDFGLAIAKHIEEFFSTN